MTKDNNAEYVRLVPDFELASKAAPRATPTVKGTSPKMMLAICAADRRLDVCVELLGRVDSSALSCIDESGLARGVDASKSSVRVSPLVSVYRLTSNFFVRHVATF
jgi:hypothetical protein